MCIFNNSAWCVISLVMGHIPCVFLVNESPSAASFLYAFYQTSKKVCRSNEAGVLNTLSAVMPPHVSSWAVTVPPHHTSVGAERRGFSRVGFTGEVVFMAFENNTSAHTHTHTAVRHLQWQCVIVCYVCGGMKVGPLRGPLTNRMITGTLIRWFHAIDHHHIYTVV